MAIDIAAHGTTYSGDPGGALECPHCHASTALDVAAYLPQEAQALFREALACHAAGLYTAFAALCRRTAQALYHALGERGKLQLFDILHETRALAELDENTFVAVRAVLFGSDADPWPNLPPLDAGRAGVLAEVMQDLLYQAFVRKARLKQALAARRRVTPIQAAR